ncbi:MULTISPECIES: hypothetical protein [Bacillus]|uniref:hypothetical protein n=1 Tax=Bacillus TaxID=1386 RepID=UPI000DADE00D|nr:MULTISPECIES: hypothetical protein [Bacillus]MED1481583.1 hypothetical protein [Bacillus altitudinis]
MAELSIPGFFVKFLQEEHVESFLDGNLYMNNFQYFIDMENETKQRGQGDNLEAAFVARSTDSRIVDKMTKRVVGFAQSVDLIERYTDVKRIPLFCFSYFSQKDFQVYDETEESFFLTLNVKEEEKKSIFKEFGNTAVLLPFDFLIDLQDASNENEDSFFLKPVEYCDYDVYDSGRKKLFDEKSIEMLFWKDHFFKYQREVRFLLTEKKTSKPIFFKCKNLKGKSMVMKSEEFLWDLSLEIIKT